MVRFLILDIFWMASLVTRAASARMYMSVNDELEYTWMLLSSMLMRSRHYLVSTIVGGMPVPQIRLRTDWLTFSPCAFFPSTFNFFSNGPSPSASFSCCEVFVPLSPLRFSPLLLSQHDHSHSKCDCKLVWLVFSCPKTADTHPFHTNTRASQFRLFCMTAWYCEEGLCRVNLPSTLALNQHQLDPWDHN